MMDNSLITIIIPMFNVEHYIERCLNSIFKQNYRNIELILIDDCSGDQTLKLCEYLRSKCPFDMTVICNNENRGVSFSRNRALKMAKGEYVAFVDADDYVEPGYISELYDICKSHKDYLPMCKSRGCDFLGVDDTSIDMVDSVVYLYNQYHYHPQSWGCLFNVSTILEKGISFCEDAKFAEDAYFVAKYVMYMKGVCILNKHLYIYDVRDGTGSAQRKDKRFTASDVIQRKTSLYALDDAITFAQKKGEHTISKAFVSGYCFLAADIILMNERCAEWSKDILKEMKKHLKLRWVIKYLIACKNKKHILLVIAMRIYPQIGKKAIDLFGRRI